MTNNCRVPLPTGCIAQLAHDWSIMVLTGASGSAVCLQSPHQVATAEQGVQPARSCIHVRLC